MKYVISVGGSLIVPDEIDTRFLKQLKSIVKESRHRFVLIVGGGRTSRVYQEAAAKAFKLKEADVDWTGIHATWMNADFVRKIFGRLAHGSTMMDYSKKKKFKEKVLVGGGWKPGFSTDYDAVLAAKHAGAEVIVNLTNVDYVYDKDPKYYKNAKAYPALSWDQMFKIMGDQRIPGGHWPFDPKACRLAKKLGIKVVILNGKNLKNLKNFLKGKKFKGTVIK